MEIIGDRKFKTLKDLKSLNKIKLKNITTSTISTQRNLNPIRLINNL